MRPNVVLCRVVLVSGWLAGCGAEPPMIEESLAVARGEAREAHVEVHFAGGRLRVAAVPAATGSDGEDLPPADALLAGNCAFDQEAMGPAVGYRIEDGRGRLSLGHRDAEARRGRSRNDWQLGLARDLPLSLFVGMGVGRCEMRLAGVALRELEARVDTGEIHVDFTGCRVSGRLPVRLDAAGGGLFLRVPTDVGVRLIARNAVGEMEIDGLEEKDGVYVNAAYETAADVLDLSVAVGMGVVQVRTGP